LDLVEDDDCVTLAFFQVLEERAFDGVDVAEREGEGGREGGREGGLNKTKTITEHAGIRTTKQRP
jgi:hypothetical protein